MNLVFTNKIDGIDLERLMDIYEESNWENLSMVKSDNKDISDKNILYQKVRTSYKSYIQNEFLKNGNNYLAILKDEKNYLAALRIYDEDDFYLIEALETKPEYRRCGYGENLLREAFSFFEKGREIRSEVSLTNKKRLDLHKKLGFKIIEKRRNNLLLTYKID